MASLAVDETLPERTVIVRNESVAHAWRRDLVLASRGDLLIGTRFVTPLAAAVQILENAGVEFAMGEEAARAPRLAALIASQELPLAALDLTVLREKPGWDVALAATLADVEAAGLDASKLRASGDARCTDVAELMDRLGRLAPGSWTASRVLAEAARLLAANPTLWPFDGPSLVEVTGHESVVLARFLRAMPRVTFQRIAAQPARRAHSERVAALFGELPPRSMAVDGPRELDLLARYLFSAPEILTDSARPRSEGPDGTVHLEEHAGVEEELDAAVAWIVGEIAERGTPLEQIAVVVPNLEPYAGLLAERLDVLGPDSVHVVGGLPATGTSAGARILTVLRALASYLHIESLADVLPILRLPAEDAHLSRRDAIATLYQLGTAGGSVANPAGGLEWAERIARRQEAIAKALAELRKDEDAERERRSLERTLQSLKAVRAGMESLGRVAKILVEDGSLAALWSELQGFLKEHVRLGAEGQRILASVDSVLEPLLGADLLFGEAALEAIVTTLRSVRLNEGRFGEPRVTIVSLLDAVGLSFRAVRVLGLAEGSVPSNVREDPVLPDAARAKLGLLVARSENRALAQVHALHRVVSSTADRLVLSVARMDPSGSYREPSGVLIEAGAALGRPPLGRAESPIPDARLMRQVYFAPARRAAETTRDAWPIQARRLLAAAAKRRESLGHSSSVTGAAPTTVSSESVVSSSPQPNV